jgi:hypothetical protein
MPFILTTLLTFQLLISLLKNDWKNIDSIDIALLTSHRDISPLKFDLKNNLSNFFICETSIQFKLHSFQNTFIHCFISALNSVFPLGT